MKKIFYVGVLSILLLTACGNKDEASTKKDTDSTETAETTETQTMSEYPFPSSDLIGDATITVSTPAGDSSNGNVPVLYVNDDDLLIQIGIEYANFDGSLETYVYINEIYNTTEQVGELTQSSLDLSGDNLKPGDYVVTAVQFEGNDINKNVVTKTEAKFKIE